MVAEPDPFHDRPREAAAYLAELNRELAALAARCGLVALAALHEAAAAEAERQARSAPHVGDARTA